MTPFEPEKILDVLNQHGVRYVLIGGLAASLHGAVTPTFDVDIVPERKAENLEKLSAALSALDARIRVDGVEEGLAFRHDAGSLASVTVLNLVTRHGPLDIAGQPAGLSSYEDWASNALTIDLHGLRIQLAELGDVIRSKEAADREKDRIHLPYLRALQQELDQGRDLEP